MSTIKVPIASARFLVAVSLIAVSVSSLAQTADPTIAAVSGDSLKARLSNLVEVTPNSFSTDIELFGVEPLVGPAALPTLRFHVKGKILSFANKRNNWFNSDTYVVVAEPDHVVIELQDTRTDGFPLSGGDESIDGLMQIADDGQLIRGNLGLRFKSVRFFNGMFDGKKPTLIIRADKWGEGPGYPGFSPGASVTVMISLYELQSDEVDLPGHFVRMAHFITSRTYCNTDLALLRELAIPLPAVYAGKTITCG